MYNSLIPSDVISNTWPGFQKVSSVCFTGVTAGLQYQVTTSDEGIGFFKAGVI